MCVCAVPTPVTYRTPRHALTHVGMANAPREEEPEPTAAAQELEMSAAAGAVELITCVLAIKHGVLPPTRNLNHPDSDLDLDYVANTARKATVDTCLSNNFGFGGQNDTLIVKRFEG